MARMFSEEQIAMANSVDIASFLKIRKGYEMGKTYKYYCKR